MTMIRELWKYSSVLVLFLKTPLLYGKSDAGLKIQGKRLKKTDPYIIFFYIEPRITKVSALAGKWSLIFFVTPFIKKREGHISSAGYYFSTISKPDSCEGFSKAPCISWHQWLLASPDTETHFELVQPIHSMSEAMTAGGLRWQHLYFSGSFILPFSN